MKTIHVKHPKTGKSTLATIYSHSDTKDNAAKIASNICGGFILQNKVTKKWTVFYPSTIIDFANKF